MIARGRSLTWRYEQPIQPIGRTTESAERTGIIDAIRYQRGAPFAKI